MVAYSRAHEPLVPAVEVSAPGAPEGTSRIAHSGELGFGMSHRERGELAMFRLVLNGESVVDLPRMWFTERATVDRFLELLRFDTDNPMDLQRLRELHREATVYLSEEHKLRLPERVEHPDEIHDIFLAASLAPPRIRRSACMTLKVMHILSHIAARELAFRISMSEAQMLERLNARVFFLLDRMRSARIEVREFTANQKTRSSMVTKLLAKRSDLATHIFDKLRFRIVVASRQDVLRSVSFLLNHLIPFNYVLPEQSQNSLVSAEDLADYFGTTVSALGGHFVERLEPNAPQNEFSGNTYRCLNFVANIPVRVDDLSPQESWGSVFVQTEVQLLDEVAAQENERGDNAHRLYKRRQKSRARRRLDGISESAE